MRIIIVLLFISLLLAFAPVKQGTLTEQGTKRDAHITCRIMKVDGYGVTTLACTDEKTDEQFEWRIPEDEWPGSWGVNRFPGHLVRAGRKKDGTLAAACRLTKDCHPADAACLQVIEPANKTCDFHDEG